jgi:hypothetical protein
MERTLSTAIQRYRQRQPIKLSRFDWEYFSYLGYPFNWSVDDFNRAKKTRDGYLGIANGIECYLIEND